MEVAAAPMLAISPLRKPFDSAAPMDTNFTPARSIRKSPRTFWCCQDPMRPGTCYFFVNLLLLLRTGLRTGSAPNPGPSKKSKYSQNDPNVACCNVLRPALARAADARPRRARPEPGVIPDLRPLAAQIANPPNQCRRRWRATGRHSRTTSDSDWQNRNRRNAPAPGAAFAEPEPRPVSVTRTSAASERSTSLTWSSAPGCGGLNFLHELHEQIHTLLSRVPGHRFDQTTHHGKTEVALAGPLQNHAVGIHQEKIPGGAQVRDRRALGDV